MIGWWIVISKQLSEKAEADADVQSEVLAKWGTGLGGEDWINNLVLEGKASQVLKGGYPNRYIAPAVHVLPLIESGPPSHEGPGIIGDDYVMPDNWVGDITINHDKIHQCAPDQVLQIEVWDQG